MIDPMMKMAVWLSRAYSKITSKVSLSNRADLLTEVRTVSGRRVVPNGVYYSPMPIIGIQPLSIEDILAPHQDTIKEIVKRSGLTSTSKKFTPDKLIREVIWKTAEYIHLLPASEDYHHSDAGGLLSHSLEVAKMALGEAYNSDLPAKTYPDLEILRRTRYFYAVFISALLHDIGKVFSDVRVFCVDKHIQWQPRLEPLTKWAVRHNVSSYRVEYVKGRGKRHERAASYVLSAVLTDEAKEYILGCQTDDIFAEIDDSITHYTERDGYINQALRRADSASTLKDIQGRHLKETGRREYSLSTHFIRATQQLTPEWTVNQKGSMMWVIGGNIYIAYPQAIIEIIGAIKAVGVNCPHDVNVVCNQMIEQHFIEPSDLQTRSAFWMSGDYTEDDAKKIQHDMVVGKKRAVWTSIVKLKSVHYSYGSLAIPQSMPGIICLNKAGDMALYRKGDLYTPIELKSSDMHDRIKAEEAAKAAKNKGQDPHQLAQILAQLPDATRAQIQAIIDSQLPASSTSPSVEPATSNAVAATQPASTKSTSKGAARSQKDPTKKARARASYPQTPDAALIPAPEASQAPQDVAEASGNTMAAQAGGDLTQAVTEVHADAIFQADGADEQLDLDNMENLFGEYAQMMGADNNEQFPQGPAGHEQQNAHQPSASEPDITKPEAPDTSATPKKEKQQSANRSPDAEVSAQRPVKAAEVQVEKSSDDRVESNAAPQQPAQAKQHSAQELHEMTTKCSQWLWWCADERDAGVMCYRVEGEKVYLRLKLLSNRLMLKQREISYTLKACGMIDPMDPTEAPANQRYTIDFETERGIEPHCLLNRKACDLMLMTPSQRKRAGLFATPSQKGSGAPSPAAPAGGQVPVPAQEYHLMSAMDMEKPVQGDQLRDRAAATSTADAVSGSVSEADNQQQDMPVSETDKHQLATEESLQSNEPPVTQAADPVITSSVVEVAETLPEVDKQENEILSHQQASVPCDAVTATPMHDAITTSTQDNQSSGCGDEPMAEPPSPKKAKPKTRNKKLANVLLPLPAEGEADTLEVQQIARMPSTQEELDSVEREADTIESEADTDETGGVNKAALEIPAGLRLTDMQELFANIDRYWNRKAEYQRSRLVLVDEKATALEASYFTRVTADALGFPIEEVAEFRRKIGDKWYYVIPNPPKK
ncbi:MAG: MobH family relaxase [Aeromonas popoffii]|uniref:MobH family relaxase n=1 Tax=Aeromonas popoffii TaxID=70856 RepID=UPI003F385241